ncbi:IscS subfamily cysteine desulfurase [Aliikangiella sp. IMCC44653]
MKKVIYLDYAATTPVDQSVVEEMTRCLSIEGDFGNPASRSHRYGWQAEELVDIARNQVAESISADPREIVWTSGATEANNLALKGIAESHGKGHIVTSAIEHKAVLDTCEYLASIGFDITYVAPNKQGEVEVAAIEAAIKSNTILISIMHVNNETGAVQNIVKIGELAHSKHIPFHVDAAQSIGKLNIDVTEMPIDMISMCAHKVYGPKGVGALYVKRNLQPNIKAQIHGGGHERGLRSGTLATHQLVGMGRAFELALQLQAQESARVLMLKQRFWQGVKPLQGVHINGDLEASVAGILNLRFDYVDSETLLMAFKDIAVSSGSACTSASVEPSYVLKAMGLSDEQAHASLRFSFGRYTTTEDIDNAIEVVATGLAKLRALSPEWLARS